MGEPGDELEFTRRNDSVVQELPQGEAAITNARQDVNLFHALSIRYAQDQVEEIQALRKAVEQNTRATALLVKELREKNSG